MPAGKVLFEIDVACDSHGGNRSFEEVRLAAGEGPVSAALDLARPLLEGADPVFEYGHRYVLVVHEHEEKPDD